MESLDFQKAVDNLREIGFNPVPDLVHIAIPNAKDILWRGIQYFAGNQSEWLPEYEEITQWLSQNNGRGLLCIGNCGRGKTLICGKVIPILVNYYHRKIISCYDAQEMNAKTDIVKLNHLIYIDDIGTENMSVKYGEKRMAFPELVDEAEKKGKLLIITTNLSISELNDKYGERTVDRLRSITTPILFKGKSLRK